MKSLRYYFVGNDLDDLEHLEEELEAGGIATPQIHVLSHNDTEVAKHPHLHEVQSITKLDLVHSTLIGAAVGLFGLGLIFASAYLFNLTEAVGWMPFILLAILVFGFCSWEGGLIGISISNYKFRRFDDQLKQGKHILFVDVTKDQEGILNPIINKHPNVSSAGTGKPMPFVLSFLQKHFGMIRNS